MPYKEATHAYQIQPALLIGFFDDIFYRAFNPNWLVTNPSTNFLVLLGCLLALVYLRRLVRDRVFVAIAVSALCSASLVFGVVPSGVIERIPMVKNIWHIDNTFSCVPLIELFVLAGFGLSYFVQRCARRRWKLDYAFLALGLLILFGAWFGFTHANQRIPNDFTLPEQAAGNKFFYIYALSLFAALLALPWLLRAIVRRSRFRRAAIPLAVLCLLCLLCLHWRHGFQLHTGASQIDDFVVNPPPRIDLREPWPAIDSIQSQPGVFRTVGFGSILFPGVNGMFGLESIYGPDPLANPYYHELLTAAGVRQEWSWRWIVERANLKPRPLYNLLNVRYFLDMPPRSRPEPAITERPRFDLDVSRNEGKWPRAFFIDALRSYDRVDQFLEQLRQADSHPFAAAQAEEAAVPAVEPTATAAVPAHDYRLTNNTTTFTVDATAPGVAVLTEAYVPGDFRVTVNGAPADYFRVNHAFRGVRIPAAGKYVVSYSYWPRHFTLSLIMAAIGSLILIAWLTVTLRRPRGATDFAGAGLPA